MLTRDKRDFEENEQNFRNKRLTTRRVGDVDVVVQGDLSYELFWTLSRYLLKGLIHFLWYLSSIFSLIDPNYKEESVPVTLSPRLVQDQFAVRRALNNQVRPQEIIRPTSVVKTEYSTFTYFVTSLNPAGQTVTSTDIIVSSNVVTETINVEPTPGLPGYLVWIIYILRLFDYFL